MSSTKYIGIDVQGKYFYCSAKFRRQGSDGMRYRDQSEHDSAVLRFAAGDNDLTA
jgi:hypothetical protein